MEFASIGVTGRVLGQALKRLDSTMDAWTALSSRDQGNPSARKQRIERISGERGLGHSKRTTTNTIISRVDWRSSGRIIDSSSETTTRRKTTHITAVAGPLNLLPTSPSWQSGNIQRRNRLTNQHGVSGQNKTPRTLGGTSRVGNYEPEYSALDLLPAIQAAMPALNNAARPPTEARDLLTRVRNARGYCPVVGLASRYRR